MAQSADVSRYLENLKAKQEAVTLYERLAAAETNPNLVDVYRGVGRVIGVNVGG